MSRLNPFGNHSPGVLGPATMAQPIVPNDLNLVPGQSWRWLYISVAGSLTVMMRDDTAPITLPAVPVGIIQIWVRQVFATGTTASGIIGFN